ncbi:site-2 protease family protein [Peptostreptococcus equinus]|uniref:Site-2 protease family protein n=1 Tax=Peptostreptococcus equinus TaxID=3003601 RepID=A0ABY7JL44_9FIRM|nr:site-2 protease family protein [Peptostreptococcus sp. CBA3647]WAW14037.1 site-2 protease family protein [Peptostreptococcus sp. CBA3647]
MNLSFLNSISSFLVTLLAILFSLSIHEFGHAFVANLNGDPTAKNLGRMTINPIKHIDAIGMLMMFIIRFGWAKPVPVNTYNFKNYKIGNITVSLAGIFMNLLSAVIFANILQHIDSQLANDILMNLVIYNIAFASFNILPLPPLDGWNLIATFLPARTIDLLNQYSRYVFIVFVIMMFTNTFSLILNPIYFTFTRLVESLIIF